MEANKKFGFINFIVVAFSMLFFASYLEASIVLKAAAVNPSPDTEKEVELRIPLPKEVQPEHIISSGDLQVDFDDQNNTYYVHRKFRLPPKGSIVREVEIEDIWLIDDAELTPLQEEAEKLWLVCKNSEFASQASFLKNNIDSGINQIMQVQSRIPLSPQEHISDYRKNLERLEEVLADLESLKQLASQVKPISAKTIWQLIIFVLGFLGIVAAVFIFIWRRYLKAPQMEKLKTPEEEGQI
ncbi:hypothetical protein ACFL1D_04415 [Candidatus Omnitrophota bacterium]